MELPLSGSRDPESSQPRMFGGPVGSAELPWSWATERLSSARIYWIATTRPDGRPHSRPVWGIWLDLVFSFSTGSLAAQNLATQPAIPLHLERGDDVVIIEGRPTRSATPLSSSGPRLSTTRSTAGISTCAGYLGRSLLCVPKSPSGGILRNQKSTRKPPLSQTRSAGAFCNSKQLPGRGSSRGIARRGGRRPSRQI